MTAAELSHDESRCAGPHCTRSLPRAGIASGRPPKFCSPACRQAAYRARVAERAKTANTISPRDDMAANDVDELRQRVGQELASIAGLVDMLLAEAEHDGGHLGAAATTLAVEVNRLTRSYGGDPGHLLPATKARDETPHSVTESLPIAPAPAEPRAQILRTASLESEGLTGWRLAQDAEGRIWHQWQLQLDEVTVGLIGRVSHPSGRIRGWEARLHSCPSPRGPWETRTLAALQGVDAYQRHLQRERKRRSGRPQS